MLRAHKWMAPVVGLALLAGFGSARAEDAAKPAGKATITVTVVDADGKAVDGATVGLYMPPAKAKEQSATPAKADPKTADDMPPATPAPKEKAKPLSTATTDASGKAELKDVADGSYVVRAKLKGSGNGREKVTVTDGKDAAVSVTLKKKAA